MATLAIIPAICRRKSPRFWWIWRIASVAIYAAVYAVFIHPVYGLLQLFVALAIPLLARYNGQRGSWPGMKWFFYLYYPLHLLLCGLVRLGLHGDTGVMIGG